MRNAGFDSRLYRVLALLGGLTLIVGLLAIGVNRYLVRIHEATLARALPVAEAASRIRVAADLAATLTAGVRQAGTVTELDTLRDRLGGALQDIGEGIEALTDVTSNPEISPEVAPLQALLDPMARDAAAAIRLGERRAELAREIGRMEQALNVLRLRAQEAQRLRRDMERAVQAATSGLVDEMQAADAARNAAVEADRGKSVFLARMSHEIRTPLNGMIGMLELMAADETTPDRRMRLDTALISTRDLLRIANDILDFASADAADGTPRPVHFWLRDLIGQIHAPLAALAAQKGLAVSVDLADDAPPVLKGDVARIRQVMTNLVSNAVKYTDRGGIALLIDHAPDPATGRPVIGFTVADTGVGMAQEQVAQIFDGYRRPDWMLRAGGEGAGLGLAIARRLTATLGGDLSVESVPGVGSRFTLTVPLDLGDPTQIALSDPPQMPRFDAVVLVVEDHPVNCMVARGFLERLGCRVIEAESAAAADAVIAAGGFDLALVDLGLPDRPGHEVIAALRDRRPGLPVAALTADPVARNPEARDELGVDAVLAKPVSPRELAELLDRLTDARMQVSLDADIAQIGAETVQAMVAAFLEDLPGALDAITGSTGEARRKAAHRLKGAASNFGLEAFCALLHVIETAPGDLDEPRLRSGAQAAHAALTDAAKRHGLQPPASASSR